MKLPPIIVSLFLLASSAFGQGGNKDLALARSSLANAQSDTARMKAYKDLAAYYILEDRDSTTFYLDKALPIAVNLDLKFDEAQILNRTGIILMQQEKFAKSIECYLKAIDILKEPTSENTIWELSPGETPRNRRLLELSNSYDLIGLLNAYSGNWVDNIENQMKNYREAEKYAQATGNSRQLAYINFHIGIAHLNEGKLDSALLLINKAVSTFTELKDPSGLGRATIYLGETYDKMGNYPLAASTILSALPLLRETNDQVHIAIAYIWLNRVYTHLDKNDSALYYTRESLKIFEKRKDPFGKKDAYNLLSSHFDRIGQADSAIVYLKLAKSLSDSLSEQERKNLLAFQDVIVAEQEKLKKLEREKIEGRERLRIYLLLAGIIVFLSIAILLYRNNQQRRKANETLRRQNEEIEHALNQLRATQTQLIHSEKMASLGELTAGIAHEIENPLNFVNNFAEVNTELNTEGLEAIRSGDLKNAEEIMGMLEENNNKILHHGKRADAIVKGMLQHSRSSAGQSELTDVNALCDEFLRLAYLGLRAKDKAFNALVETHFDPAIGKVSMVRQDMGRVILNLINNAFYAVNLRLAGSPEGYAPTVRLATSMKNGRVEISVKDNGDGIPEAIRDKVFQPFFTTKPPGQGTGLGLSISYDIVKAHGGDMRVDSKPGEGSTFVISIPV